MKLMALLFSLLLFFAGFSNAAFAGEEKPKQEKIFSAVIDKDGVQRVEIVGGGYLFTPNHIIVKLNIPVELKVRKEPSIVPHNIVMKSPDAGMEFELSLREEPQTVSFTPTKTGVYSFYCSKKLLFFKSHQEKGMKGAIEVVE